MPKDEFDFEDPLELNGVALLTAEDTMTPMAECFVEEFMRLGYNHKQILALFRNPHYLGMNLVMQNKGEPFVRDVIAETFARWGRPVTWSSQAAAPLTPALAPSEVERENQSPRHEESERARTSAARTLPSPLPGGEGQGQGEVITDQYASSESVQVIELDTTSADPMGAAVPKLNL